MGFLDRLKGGSAGPDALTAEIAARLRALPDVVSAEGVDADRVSVAWGGLDEPQTVDLADLRPRWKSASGFDRIELVDQFIESLSPGSPPPPEPPEPAESEPPEPEPPAPAEPEPTPAAAGQPAPTATSTAWDQVRSRVLPVLRPAGGGPDGVRWSIDGGLDAAVVADGLPLAPGDCERWGVSELDVRAAATVNLRGIDPAPEPIGPGARAWVPTAPAGGQSAWMTDPGRLLEAVGLDEGIAFAPVAAELVVVDPADAQLLGTILASTERIVLEQAEPVTPLPFVLTAGGAHPWVPAADHPLAEAVAALRRRAGAR